MRRAVGEKNREPRRGVDLETARVDFLLPELGEARKALSSGPRSGRCPLEARSRLPGSRSVRGEAQAGWAWRGDEGAVCSVV